MVVTLDMVAKCTGASIDHANIYYPMIISCFDLYEVNTPIRKAAFMSQIGEESGGLRWTTELWGPTAAQLKYEFDADLGNTVAGDGKLYRGRGLIQTTGKYNYGVMSKELGVDFVKHPELLATPEYAVKSAFIYWKKHKANDAADKEDIVVLTKKINGGLNGYDKRLSLFKISKGILLV